MRQRVRILEYLSVATTVGKKLVTPALDTIPRTSRVKTYVRGSLKANLSPVLAELDPPMFACSSASPTSTSSLHWAICRSSGVNHFVVAGKLGKMKYEMMAMPIVIPPSMMLSSQLICRILKGERNLQKPSPSTQTISMVHLR